MSQLPSNMGLIFHDELISSPNTHPLLLNPPYKLTLQITDLITPKEVKEKKEPKKRKDQSDKGEIEQIPRPHNAFIIFRTDYAARIKNESNKRVSIRVVSRLASKRWKMEPDSVKTFFKLLAEMYQQRHRVMYPGYKYVPKNKPNSPNESKKKNKSKKKKITHQVITWYIHDDMEEDCKPNNTDSYTRNNLSEDHSQSQQTTETTFINYMGLPSSSPSLSTTSPIPTYHCYDNFIINNDNTSSPPPPPNNLFLWEGSHNNGSTEPSLGLPLLNFDTNYFQQGRFLDENGGAV